ncbi:hypothetical protein [Thauera butanivorans]|uniref:hypothetical protein n=1 Tax=Thauera butanivorans TaxID=86174 RepID=UPI0012FA6F69|nr:hypothetical protein [Thauera butanivorans]
MRRVIVLGALLAALVPGLVFALFPIALLPGVALVFESGTLAASYAAAIALVGSAIAWLHFQPSPPPPSALPSRKVSVRFDQSEVVIVPPGSYSSEYSPGQIQILPNYAVPASPSAVTSWANNTQYQGSESQLRNVFRCTVGQGCTENVGTRLRNERDWVHESAGRYLMFTFNSTVVKIDPHNVASIDGASLPEFGGCPPGYGYFNGGSQSCEEPNPDDGRIAQQSDGVCAYIYDADGKRLAIDPANYLEHGAGIGQHTYLTDPDCYGRPQTVTKLEMGQGDHTATVEVLPSGFVAVTENKTDSDNRVITTGYSIRPDGADMKLDGGTYNNVLDPGTGPGDGGAGDGDGTGNGSGGNSGGTCGGTGQPACKIDDSGFAGADAGTGLDDALSAIDARSDALGDFADSDIGVGWDWLPSLMPGVQLECTALVFEPAITHGPAAGLGGSYELDICDKLGTVREIIGWLFGLFTVFYVWRKFANSNGGMS